MNKLRLSSVAAVALIGSIGIVGCGGGGGSSTPVGVTSISGIVSDGPIKNARVFIDENFDGEYNPGEPMAFTDEDGKYSIDIVPETGKEYLLVAEGSSALETEDSQDNSDVGAGLTFTMFSNSKSSSNLNPTTMKTYLASLSDTFGTYNPLSELINASGTDTTLFQTYLKGEDKKNQAKEALRIAASKYKASLLETTKQDLGLGEESKLIFSDDSLADLDAKYNNQVVATVGNLVVTKSIAQATTVEETADELADTETEEGITISSITPPTSGTNPFYDGTTSNSPVALNKPIFSSIGDKTNKLKLVVGKKTALNNDYTVSITPYENVLEIPAYDQIKTMGYSVVLGSHIAIQQANGKKVAISAMKDVVVSGAVLHKNEGLDLSDLKYLYFDGTEWVDDDITGSNSFSGLSDSFKLVPYVLVASNTTTTGLTDVEKEIPGLSLIKNPIIVAKGKAQSPSVAKMLAKSVDDDNIILDASIERVGDNVTFKIPQGYSIEEFVIIDEDLNKISQKPSVKVAVDESLELNLATQQQKDQLLDTFEDGLASTAFEVFSHIFSFDPSYDNQDEGEFKDIIRENIKRYLLSSTTETKDVFYNPTDDNKIGFTNTWTGYTNDYQGSYIVDCTLGTNYISCTDKEYEDEVLTGSGSFKLTFTAGQMVASGSWNETETHSEYNYTTVEKENETFEGTYKRQGLDYVSVTFKSTQDNSMTNSYEYEGQSSSYSMAGKETISGVAHFKLDTDSTIKYLNSAKYNLDVSGSSSGGYESSPSWGVSGIASYLRDSSNDTSTYTNTSGTVKFEGTYSLPFYDYQNYQSGYSMLKGKALLSGTYTPSTTCYDSDSGYCVNEVFNHSMFTVDSQTQHSYSSSSSGSYYPAKMLPKVVK